MEKFQAVLLNVWRESCRHIEISKSAESIAALLMQHMPVGRMLVRLIDAQRSCLETVAFEPPSSAPPDCDACTRSSTVEIEDLKRRLAELESR